MDLDWIEDMLTLLDERNFSRAANRRHISQPAFSRRIQSLEQWVGIELVDRASKPIGFTVDEEQLKLGFQSLKDKIFELRGRIRAASHTRTLVRIGAQQALTISIFPELTRTIQNSLGNASFRIHSANRDSCVAMFLRRNIDILLCYETDQYQARIPSVFARKALLCMETLLPVVKSSNASWRRARSESQQTLPLLSYPPESFLGKVVNEHGLRGLLHKYDVEVICESAFSSGLKEMVLQDMGIAWLPRRLIQSELDNDSLRDLSKRFGSIDLQVSLFWARSSHSDLATEVVDVLETIFDPQSPDDLVKTD